MAAVVIESEFRSVVDARRWQINVWDSTGSATVSGIDNDGFKIIYDESETLLEPIKGSQCVVKLIDDGSSLFVNFKSALSTAAEDRFKLIIKEYISGAWVIHWAGVIVPDTIEWYNQSVPRFFVIRAIDGLKRLEKIPFDNIFTSPYTTSPQTFLKIIFDCLGLNGLAQFWNGSSRHYIRTNIDWYDTQQTLATVTRVLENVRAEAWAMVKKDSDTDKQYADEAIFTLEIIRSILSLLGARIIMSKGSYYIMQPRSYEAANVSTFSNYNYLGAYISTSASESIKTQVYAPNDTPNDLHVVKGGKYSYLPALNKAKINTVPMLYIVPFSGVVVKWNTSPQIQSGRKLGTLRGGAGSGMTLMFSFIIDSVQPEPHSRVLDINITLRAGTYRLKNVEAPPDVYNPKMGWSTTSADYFTARGLFKDGIAVFRTPEIPFPIETGCEVDIDFSVATYAPRAGTIPASFHIRACQVQFMSGDSVVQIEEYELINPDTTANSIELDLGTTVISDTGVVSSVATLEVQTTQTSGQWNQSSVWEAGFTTDYSLVQSLLLEAMAMQRKPPQRYTGGFSGDHQAHLSVYYDGLYWFLLGAKFNANMNQWDGVWATTQQVKTGMTTTKKIVGDNGGKGDNTGGDKGRDQSSFRQLERESKGYADAIIFEDDGAITSIGVGALDNEQIRDGDTIYAIDPFTGDILEDFEVSADATIGATSVSVVSKTPDNDLPELTRIIHNPKEIVASQIGRFDTLLVGGVAAVDSVAEINLTFAQLRALYTTQIPVLSNPTSGYHYEISAIKHTFTAGIAYSNIQDIQLRGITTDVAHWKYYSSRLIANANKDDTDDLLTHPILANEGLEFYTPSNLTTGTGTLRLIVRYKIIAN